MYELILSRLVEICIPETVVAKQNCTFNSIQEKHFIKRRSSFFMKISLPLVRKGYNYIFNQSRQKEPRNPKILDQPIFWFLKQRLQEMGLSSKVQFSNIVNSLENLEIPRNGHGRLKYAKNLLSKELGDSIFGVDPTLKNELTVDVHLNDILPTVEYDKKEIIGNYGRSKAYEDKDIPLKVKIFPLSSKCGEASESVKDLIILIQLAKSGSMLGIDGEIWKTLSKV